MHETKTPIPPNATSGTQSLLKLLIKLLSVRLWDYQKIVTGSFRFKVMNSPIYSIQREVINEFEYLVSNIAFTLIFGGDNCPSSHCLLSINQVSFQSLLYFPRYF